MYKNTEREEANAKCYRIFCNNVKAELRKRDLAYKQIAPEIDMSVGVFSQKIARSGNGNFSLHEIIGIARFLDMSLDELVGFERQNNRRFK